MANTTLTNGELPKPPTKGTWTQNPSNANEDTPPKYPYNNITQTESGHSFEMDDTPNGERIRLQHGRKETFIEMQANGDMQVKVKGDGYEIIAGNKNVSISGFCNITINGDCNMHVLGNKNEQIDGDYNIIVKGEYNMRSKGDAFVMSDSDMNLQASENFGGTLRLGAADSLYLDADLHIGGSITCDSLTAESRVNAGMGVTAGPYGFTSGLGGLSLGFPTAATPVATPGSITTVGPISTLMSVNGLEANFLTAVACSLLVSIKMTDIINTIFYDTHIHPTPEGPTGTTPMAFA